MNVLGKRARNVLTVMSEDSAAKRAHVRRAARRKCIRVQIKPWLRVCDLDRVKNLKISRRHVVYKSVVCVRKSARNRTTTGEKRIYERVGERSRVEWEEGKPLFGLHLEDVYEISFPCIEISR